MLVTIAKKGKLVEYVLDALLQKFPPGLTILPHRYVFVTLAMIAERNCEFLMVFLFLFSFFFDANSLLLLIES